MADKTLQDLLNAQKETNKKLDKALKDVENIIFGL